MAENGRLSKVNSIIGAFDQIMAAHRGDVVCSVTTAKVCLSVNPCLTSSLFSTDMVTQIFPLYSDVSSYLIFLHFSLWIVPV